MTENIRTLNGRFFDFLQAVRTDGLIISSAVLFSLSMVGNLANYFFQFFMSRHLTPSEYGTLNALLSLLVIVSIPGGAITMVVANYVSRYKARNEYGAITRFFSGSLKYVGLIGIGLLLIFAFLSRAISDFLRIPSIGLVLIVSLMLATSLWLTVNFGMLQGLQKFKTFGITGSLGNILRLIFGIFLIYLGFNVAGALWAGVMANLLIIVLTFFLLRYVFEHQQDTRLEYQTQDVFYYGFPVAISLFCYTAMTNLDVVLVKHYFDGPTAGQYAAASILAKVILYLPGAIVLALFPKISEMHALAKDSIGLLFKALLLTGVLSGVAVGVYLFYPSVVVLLFGQKFSEATPLIGLFGLAMLPFALLNIMINFFLAKRDTRFIYVLVGGTVLQLILIIAFHQTLPMILWIILFNGMSILLLNFLLLGRSPVIKNIFRESRI